MVEHINMTFLLQFFDILVVALKGKTESIPLSERGHFDCMWRQGAANHFFEVTSFVFLQNVDEILRCTLGATPWKPHALQAGQRGSSGNDAFVVFPFFLLVIPPESEFQPVVGGGEATQLVEFIGR